MEQLYKKIRRISRSVSPENFTGEKGCMENFTVSSYKIR